MFRNGLTASVGVLLGLVLTEPSKAAEPAASPPNVAKSGEFGVLQVATTEPDRFMAEWQKPSQGVAVPNAKSVRRNQPIVTFIVFYGCRADASGLCNVTADFETTAPTGAVYDRTNAVKVWVGHPRPATGRVELSEGALGMRIENKDLLGTYMVRATITDHVSGMTLTTSQPFVATE